MPLLKKQPFEPEPVPEGLSPESQVFFCPATREVFRDYDAFFNRTILLNSLVWSCSVTGKSSLTFEEAEESERAAVERLGALGEALERPLGYLLLHSQRGRLDDLIADLWQVLKGRYFRQEVLETFASGERQAVTVTDVHFSETPVQPALQEAAEEGSSKRPREELSLPDPAHYLYDLRFPDGATMSAVSAAKLFRAKNALSKAKLRLFVKNYACVPVDRWTLKPELVQAWAMAGTKWTEVLAGPEPVFPVTPMAKAKNLTPCKDDTPEVRREKKAAAAKRKEERILKDAKFLKAKEAQTAELEMLAQQAGNVGMTEEEMARWTSDVPATKLLSADDVADFRVAIKEARKANRESLAERRKREKEALVEWRKARDDLTCDDLKPLPPFQPLRLPPWLSDGQLCQALGVLEFCFAFRSSLHHDTCPLPKEGEALGWLLGALRDGQSSDENELVLLLVWLLRSLGKVEAEEDGDEAAIDLKPHPDWETCEKTTEAAVGAELERQTFFPHIRDATKASESTRMRFGASLRSLPIDHVTVSENLRLALAQAGYYQGPNTARHRYLARGGFRSWDDGLMQLRMAKPQLLDRLAAASVLQLSPADKLDILEAFCNQLLTYSRFREAHEKRLDAIRSHRSELKALERAEEKASKDFRTTQLERSYEQRLKDAYEEERAQWEKDKEAKPEDPPPPPSPPEIPPRPTPSKDTLELRAWLEEHSELFAAEDEDLAEEDVSEGAGELARAADLDQLSDEEVRRVRCIQEALYKAERARLVKAVEDAQAHAGLTFLGRDRSFRRFSYSEIARLVLVEEGDEEAGPCEEPTPLDRIDWREEGESDEALRRRLRACTGDEESCPVHGPSTSTRPRLHRIRSVEELRELTDALNPRGHREAELAESLASFSTRLARVLDKGTEEVFDEDVMAVEAPEISLEEIKEPESPPELTLTLDDLPSPEELESLKEAKKPRKGFPSVDVEEVRCRILELEREVELGGLGSLSLNEVKTRQAWRKSLEEKDFRPQVLSIEALGREEPVWQAGEPCGGVVGLRLALLQVMRSLYLQCLDKPFVDRADEGEGGGERTETAAFIAWQQGLADATSPAQVALHLATARQAVLWKKSKLQARCKECRRKGELIAKASAVDMVLCDACDRCCHLACVRPKPLTALPAADAPPWLCTDCRKKKTTDKKPAPAPKEKEKPKDKVSPSAAKTKPTKNGHLEAGPRKNGVRTSPKAAASPRSEGGAESDSSTSRPSSRATAGSAHENDAASTKTKTGRVVKRKRAFDELPSNTRSPSPASTSSAKGASPSPPQDSATERKRKRPVKRVSLPEPSASGDMSEAELREFRTGLRGKGLSAADLRRLQAVLEESRSRTDAWPFQAPVDAKAVPLYYQVIQRPMDLKTMSGKLRRREYATAEEVLEDARLIFANCRAFNEEDCEVAKAGEKLERWMLKRFAKEGFGEPPSARARSSL